MDLTIFANFQRKIVPNLQEKLYHSRRKFWIFQKCYLSSQSNWAKVKFFFFNKPPAFQSFIYVQFKYLRNLKRRNKFVTKIDLTFISDFFFTFTINFQWLNICEKFATSVPISNLKLLYQTKERVVRRMCVFLYIKSRANTQIIQSNTQRLT